MPRHKQAAPQRRLSVPTTATPAARGDEEGELSEDELDVFGPPLTHKREAGDGLFDADDEEDEEGGEGNGKGKGKAKQKKRAKTILTAAGAGGGGVAEGGAKEKAKGKGPRAVSSTVFEGGDFDPEALAAEYATSGADGAGGGGGTAALGKTMHAQLLTAGRLEAAGKGTADVSVVTTAEGERPTFVASFAFNKKPFQDEGPLYSVPELSAVLAAVLRRQSTKRRKASASHPSVQLPQIARRAPPLFWSLVHAFPTSVEKGLETVLAEAEAALGDD